MNRKISEWDIHIEVNAEKRERKPEQELQHKEFINFDQQQRCVSLCVLIHRARELVLQRFFLCFFASFLFSVELRRLQSNHQFYFFYLFFLLCVYVIRKFPNNEQNSKVFAKKKKFLLFSIDLVEKREIKTSKKWKTMKVFCWLNKKCLFIKYHQLVVIESTGIKNDFYYSSVSEFLFLVNFFFVMSVFVHINLVDSIFYSVPQSERDEMSQNVFSIGKMTILQMTQRTIFFLFLELIFVP